MSTYAGLYAQLKKDKQAMKNEDLMSYLASGDQYANRELNPKVEKERIKEREKEKNKKEKERNRKEQEGTGERRRRSFNFERVCGYSLS